MRTYYSKTIVRVFANDTTFFEFEKRQILDCYSIDLRFASSLYNLRTWKWKRSWTNEYVDESHAHVNFTWSVILAIIAKNLATKTKSHHFFCRTTFILKFEMKCYVFASKFNAKLRNVRIHDSLIRNSVLNRSNFTYLYMRHDKSFRSHYDFVANYTQQVQSFAKQKFVLTKQNSLHVAKVEYLFFSKR